MRSGASTLSPVLGVLRVGESIGVTGQANGGWVPVNYNGRAGYVYAAYLSFDSSTTTPPVSTPTEEPSAGSTEEPSDGSTATGSGTAKTALNVRSGPSTNDRVLHVLAAGERIDVRGEVQDGWVPVIWNGQDAWVASQYLTLSDQTTSQTQPSTDQETSTERSTAYTTSALNLRTGPGTSHQVVRVLPINTAVSLTGVTQDGFSQVADGDQLYWVSTTYLTSEVTTTTTAFTTTAVNLRTGPSTDYSVVRVLSVNTEVSLTGVTQNGFSQVNDNGELRWVSTTYLSDSRVSSGQGSVQGPIAPVAGWQHLAQHRWLLRPGSAAALIQADRRHHARLNFPQITTMYGVRADSLPDHPSGRAVDIMMPNGANDQALGDEVAAFLQANANSLNIEYLIWRQRIWINGQSGWTWMADRGGITANHYDHVHVTVYS